MYYLGDQKASLHHNYFVQYNKYSTVCFPLIIPQDINCTLKNRAAQFLPPVCLHDLQKMTSVLFLGLLEEKYGPCVEQDRREK